MHAYYIWLVDLILFISFLSATFSTDEAFFKGFIVTFVALVIVIVVVLIVVTVYFFIQSGKG